MAQAAVAKSPPGCWIKFCKPIIAHDAEGQLLVGNSNKDDAAVYALDNETALISTTDFESLFLAMVALLDVRAPVEFDKGAFPGAINIPLLDDSERKQIGIRYKDQGHDAAIDLGHELISGKVKDSRMKSWLEFVKNNPDGALYCFRGGQRSKIVQIWIHEQSGINYPRISGGYKKMRRFLLDKTKEILVSSKSLVLGGRTGCHKTTIVKNFPLGINLEAMARHRGSAFGEMLAAQPAQIDFENALAIELLKLKQANVAFMLFEDEGRNIGSVAIPEPLTTMLGQAPMVKVVMPFSERVNALLQEYVIGMHANFVSHDPTNGFINFADYLNSSLLKIKKRLGGVRYETVRVLMANALTEQEKSGEYLCHKFWIEYILREYYDPSYDYQLEQKQKRIVFSGNEREVTEHLQSLARRG